MNTLELIKLCTTYLTDRKIERARRLAEELIAHALKMKRIDLYLYFDRPIVEKELVSLRETLRRCGTGEPLEYVLGEVEFGGRTFFVDKRVLIPRPETEILVEMIRKRGRGKELWDICTGSGCIGLSLKKNFEKVVLVDISVDALEVARKNAEGVDVEILEGDLFSPLKGRKADVIVSNPPYIAEDEYPPLVHEPKIALVGNLYERLTEALDHLNPGGQLYLEIGTGQGEMVKKIFGGGTVEKDWAGHDRFFFLEKQ